MKTIFLSASIPVKERHIKYRETVDVLAIRDSVLALVNICLENDIKIIWGGHPAITPLVYEAIRNYAKRYNQSFTDKLLKEYIQKHVHIFQSYWWKGSYTKDNEKFDNITYVKKDKDKFSSLLILRQQMFRVNNFAAGIFIGGMEGVEEEYALFKNSYPKALLLPIASSGAAARILFDAESNIFDSELLTNYAYNALYQKHLINKLLGKI